MREIRERAALINYARKMAQYIHIATDESVAKDVADIIYALINELNAEKKRCAKIAKECPNPCSVHDATLHAAFASACTTIEAAILREE